MTPLQETAHGVKPLVYVAGPVTGNPWGCVAQSMEAFTALRDLGVVPFCPQWSVIAEMVDSQDYETWLAYDFDIIRHCDALYRLDGESSGADREVIFAESLGIPTFSDPFLTDIAEWVHAWNSGDVPRVSAR